MFIIIKIPSQLFQQKLPLPTYQTSRFMAIEFRTFNTCTSSVHKVRTTWINVSQHIEKIDQCPFADCIGG